MSFVAETASFETGRRFSTLESRNVMVGGRRTSMRLEPAMWEALHDICRREKLSIHQLCGMVASHKDGETTFTAAIRVFVMSYFRAAATEDGHSRAGHGSAVVFNSQRAFASLRSSATQLIGEAYPSTAVLAR